MKKIMKHQQRIEKLEILVIDDAGACNQADAESFIKLNALRLRIASQKGR